MNKTMNKMYPADIAALLAEMQEGNYKHLQIFLYRNQSSLGLGLGQKYLVVNPDGFAVLRLVSVNYEGGIIQLALINEFTGEPNEIFMDINEEHPQNLFVCWEDLKNMVLDDIAYHFTEEDYPELEKL